MNGTRPERFGDTKFVAGMRAKRVMSRQLLGDLFGKRRIQPASDINRRQLLVLALVISFELLALNLDFRLFRVCLRVPPST
ncbi:MAG: hypothetical protein WBE37_07330 [Bryobacteraceae bacterium]